jgi:DNA repair protein RecO (recombination protein O)
MPAEKSLAIVLRLVEFSETSLVVTLFTRDFGKITALAKGARRPKGPFEAALDLLALVRVVFLHKSSDALDLLTEAKLERRFRAAARDLSRLYAGYYVAELLAELTDEDDPHPELFDEANRTLELLDCDAPVAAALLALELSALRLLGHLPSLRECVGCGAAVANEGRIPFGLVAGGVLCPKCRSGQRSVVSISAAALEAMRQLSEPRGGHTRLLSRVAPRPETEIDSEPRGSSPRPETPEVGGQRAEVREQRSEEVDPKILGELRGLMNNYLAHHLGHKLRMHAYLGRVK